MDEGNHGLCRILGGVLSARGSSASAWLLGLTCLVAAVGCGTVVPLKLTNQSPVTVAAKLVEFKGTGEGSEEHDWETLLADAEAIRPGETASWKRAGTGASYLLAVSGPGLEGKLGYSLFALPDAPLELWVRGDEKRVGVWLSGERPVLLRP